MFRTGGLTASEAWAVADKEVVPLRKKPVVARAIIGVAKVRETGLDVSHAVPPERHAVIVNWPTDDLEILFKTQELAAAAVLERRD